MAAVYTFVSRWRITAEVNATWDAVRDTLRTVGPIAWWPGVEVLAAPPTLSVGETMRLAVRSPLGYRLRVDLRLTEVLPSAGLSATSTGDLRGEGSLGIHAAGDAAGGVELVWHWSVSPQRAWMRTSGIVLRPLFEKAHAVVMRRGEEGLRASLPGASR